jgi:hypothetical protein
MSKVSNTNTNIQQIIFPAGYELRKVKKPKKKGTGNRKKKALEQLKTILSQYDAILNEAEERKIKIPSELGELPVNVNDINTISEIESLSAELRERIAEIEKILSTETRQQRAISLFEMPQRAGVVPQPIPVMPPTFIPPNPPPRTPAERGDLTPPDKKKPTTTTTTTGEKSTTEADLERIQQEIMGKLTAEQRAAAEQKLAELKEKAKQERAGADKEAQEKMGKEDRVVPTREKYPIDNVKFRSQTPTEEDIKILGEKFVEPVIDATRGEPDSGVGLYDKFRRVRNWMSRLKKKLSQDPENPDEYYLDTEEIRVQKQERDTIRTEYEYYIGQLDDKQAQSINDIPALKKMNESIEQILTQPVILTAEEEMKAIKGRDTIQVEELKPAKKQEPTPEKKIPAEPIAPPPPTPEPPTPEPEKKKIPKKKIIIPEKPAEPKKPAEPEEDDEPFVTPEQTDEDEPDAEPVVEEEIVTITPMKYEQDEFENFNQLMTYRMNPSMNWSKSVKLKLEKLLNSIKMGENYLKSKNENYKRQFNEETDTAVAKIASLKGQKAITDRKNMVGEYLELFNIVRGENPISIKQAKPTQVSMARNPRARFLEGRLGGEPSQPSSMFM